MDIHSIQRKFVVVCNVIAMQLFLTKVITYTSRRRLVEKQNACGGGDGVTRKFWETFELHPSIDSHANILFTSFVLEWFFTLLGGGWFGSCTSECVHLREGHPDSIDGSTFIPNLVKNRIEFDEFLKVYFYFYRVRILGSGRC
jgi:hypothetical protein